MMQSSEGIVRAKGHKKHHARQERESWDERPEKISKSGAHSEKSSYQVRQDIEDFFERKRLKDLTGEVWD